MKATHFTPSNFLRGIVSLLLFGTLAILLQTNHYLLMLVWVLCASIFSINKSMRFFIVTIIAFGIGFLLYNYVNLYWLTQINAEGMYILLNRLSLFFLILPIAALSYLYNLPFMRYWQKPKWDESVRVPFIFLGFRQTKVSHFLMIAMIIDFIAFLPYLNSGWASIQDLWGFMILFSIINSVLEEIIWRGILLSRFSEKFGNPFAVLLTSVGFGLQHRSLGFSWGICLLFILGGLFFGAITVKSKSIVPSVIWHMSINALMVLSGFIAT